MDNQKSNNSGSGNKLIMALFMVLVLIFILVSSKDKITSMIGANEVSGGYVTSAEAKKIVREFIEENPEIIIRSVQKMQQKQMEEQMRERSELVKKNQKELTSAENAIILGNPDSKVKVIKFFDYRCGHCKTAHNNIEELLKSKEDFALILKPLPLLGPDSERAARISVAAYLISPSKYHAFHDRLFKAHSLNENNLKKLAIESGYDKEVISDKMNSKEVTDIINDNKKAAGIVGLQGVPGFIIGEEFIGGSIPLPIMKEKISAVRNSKS